MKSPRNQAGFTLVEILVSIVVVLLIAGAVYWFFVRQDDAADTVNTTQSATSSDTPEAPQITSAEDLSAAEATLDSVDVDNTSDSSQLDTELSSF